MSLPLLTRIKMSLCFACVAILSACSGATVESYCAKCNGSNEAHCVEELKASESFSEKAGCDSEFQALLDCAESEGTCNHSEETCAAELEALTSCGGGVD